MRTRTLWLSAAAAIALLIVVVAGVAVWLASTDSGLRTVLAEVVARSGGSLQVEGAEGSLASQVRARRLVFTAEGKRIVAEDVSIDWAPRSLISRTLHIERLVARKLSVELAPSTSDPVAPTSLALPISIIVDRAEVAALDVSAASEKHELSNIVFAYRGGTTEHVVSDADVTSEWGRLTGGLKVGAASPFPVSGKLALAAAPALRSARVDALLDGDLNALGVHTRVEAEEAKANADIVVTPFAKTPWRSVAAQAEAFDLARFDAKLPKTALSASVQASPDASGAIAGSATLRNTMPGTIDGERLPIVALDSKFSLRGKDLELTDLQADLGSAGRASGRGRIGTERSTWELRVSALDLRRIWSTLKTTRLAGTLDAQIDGATQRIRGDVRDQGLALAFAADVTTAEVTVRNFRLTAGKGSIEGKARLARAGDERFTAEARALGVDPSAFGDYPAARLSGTVNAAGSLKPAWSATVDARFSDDSRWRGVPVSAQAHAIVSGDRARDADVRLSLGPNRVQLNGSFGRAGDAFTYAIDAANLAIVAKALPSYPVSGKLKASGRVSGTLSAPAVSVDATGSALAWGADFRAAQVTAAGSAEFARGGIGAAKPLRLELKAGGVRAAGNAFELIEANLDGSLDQHQGRVVVAGGDVNLTARVQGAFRGDFATGRWRGQVQQLSNRGAYPLELTAPADLEWRRDHVRLAGARGQLAGGGFDVRELAYDAGRISSTGSFKAFPAAPVFALAGLKERVRSTLTLDGTWSFMANPRLNGTIDIARADGDLTPTDWPDLSLGLSELKLQARSVNDRVQLTGSMRSRFANASLEATVGASANSLGVGLRTAPLTLAFELDASSLKPLQAITGTMALVDGRVRASLSGTGTLERVRLDGTIAADDIKVLAPQYGVAYEQGKIRARLARGGVELQELSFTSGDGHFQASGTLPSYEERLSASVTWNAERLRLVNRPDARLVVTGKGTLDVEPNGVKLAGALTADEGFFQFQPRRASALGDDVIVRGRERTTASTSATGAPMKLPFAVDLALDFGNRFTFSGEGFDSSLSGRLRVSTDGKQPLSARGTIDATRGVYTAFGQRLSIERGRLIFDGPLDNPALDLVALRKNLPVEAGVEVSGTVRVPRVQLTSNPPVPDNEKLSWLVLGHGPDTGTGADAAALQVAMATLAGTSSGPSFSQRVAKTVGVDDISLRNSDPSRSGPASQMVAVSKRLTDRLSLVYEQGLSVTNNALKIEYSLTPTITVRAEAGAVSGVGLYYSRSYD